MRIALVGKLKNLADERGYTKKQMASELWSVAPNLWVILSGPLPPHPAARDPMIIAIAATARPLLSRVIASSHRPAHVARRRPSGRPRT